MSSRWHKNDQTLQKSHLLKEVLRQPDTPNLDLQDRFGGLLLGTAVGEALGLPSQSIMLLTGLGFGLFDEESGARRPDTGVREPMIGVIRELARI
jgi:hypothetical protein